MEVVLDRRRATQRAVGLAILLGSALLSGCGSSGNAGTPPLPSAPPVTVAPGWHSIAGLAANVTTSGALIYADTDGFLYLAGHSATRPPVANFVYRSSMASPDNPVDITGTGLPADEASDTIGQLADGTVLVSTHGVTSTGSLVGAGGVYWWNGSVSNSVWTQITGFNRRIDQIINLFSTDANGYTYFSPEFTGEMWRNDAPSSKNFTKVLTSLYAITGGGATGHPGTGGLFEYMVWDLGDGRGSRLWAGGEGELDSIALNGDVSTNLAYGTTADGYTGNMSGLARGTNYVLFMRNNNNSPGREILHRISIANRSVTEPPQGTPRSATGFPTNLLNVYNGLRNVAGSRFIFSGRDASTPGLTYLIYSQDDGATWTDLTPGNDAGCTGPNLTLAPSVVSNNRYVWVRCQSGRRIDYYGPLY